MRADEIAQLQIRAKAREMRDELRVIDAPIADGEVQAPGAARVLACSVPELRDLRELACGPPYRMRWNGEPRPRRDGRQVTPGEPWYSIDDLAAYKLGLLRRNSRKGSPVKREEARADSDADE